MKLIKLLDLRLRGKYKIRYGIFYCCSCKSDVIKPIDVGFDAKSCGCINHSKTHGESGKNETRLHRIWKGIKSRCNNPHRKIYKYYGGKNIGYCKEWNKYENFKEWSLKNGYKESLEIDRIDNNGNYEPSNCKWSTNREQSRKRGNVYLTFKKALEIRQKYIPRKYTRKMLAKEYGVKENIIKSVLENRTWVAE